MRELFAQRQREIDDGWDGTDPFDLTTAGRIEYAPAEIRDLFPDISAAFQAAVVTSMRSEFSVRIGRLTDVLKRCESPIEARFLLGLMSAAALRDLTLIITDEDGEELYVAEATEDVPIKLYCTPQKEIGRYRVDFALTEVHESVDHAVARMVGKPEPLCPRISRRHLAVECDGHDFHEKTKEQAARDKQRDRVLFNAEYPVMRFTGSEIVAGPLRCGKCVMEWIFGPEPLHWTDEEAEEDQYAG